MIIGLSAYAPLLIKLLLKFWLIGLLLFCLILFILTKLVFVKGRNVMDNVLLAQELVHDLNVKIKGYKIIYKLDISKAYNNIS